MDGTRLLLLLVMGSLGAFIAKKRKLNPFFWFGVCFWLGISALVFLIFLPKIQKIFKKKKKEKYSQPLEPVATSPLFSPTTLWYYLDEKETQKGPFSLTRLQQIKTLGEIHDQTYVWTEELEKWKKWEEIFPSRKQEG